MQQTINISGKEEPIDLYNATVIHANKYYRTSGGWGKLPVTSTLYIDVVFRDHGTGDDWPVTIIDLDVPLYNEQEVGVICVKGVIVGYIDRKTNRYYYTTGNISSALKRGMPYGAVWVVGIILGVPFFLLARDEYKVLVFVPLLAAMIFYYVQRAMINYRITKSLDRYMTGA